MYTRTDYIMTQLGEELAHDRMREATNERLVRLALGKQPGWFSRQSRWFCLSLGRWLVTLGEALQRRYTTTYYFSTR